MTFPTLCSEARPGALEQVSVGSGNNVWSVNSAGSVYQYNGFSWSFVAE